MVCCFRIFFEFIEDPLIEIFGGSTKKADICSNLKMVK
jgi:hypothetical protein